MKAYVKPSYARTWVFLGAVAAALTLRGVFPARASRRVEAPAAAADWFLALRLPLLTEPAVRERLELERMRDWLDALERAGFEPILLSEARARLARGERLPGKPVVLLIEPGYRRTYEAVHPFLSARSVPSVWLVDGAAVERRDERYLSRHALARLRGERLSETGFLLPGSTQAFTLAGADYSFREDAGRAGLNRGASPAPLNLLNVNFSWTGSQLVSRLEAEAPVSGPTRLTTARLFGKVWGVTDTTAAAAPFDLRAPFGARSASIVWQGTRGCPDFDLDLAASALAGDLWIYLRYDRQARRGVRVGYTEGLILAEEWRGGEWKRLGAVPWSPASGGPVHSLIRLKGARLSVAAQDGSQRGFELAAAPGPRTGVILLQTYDKIRGMAGIRAMQLSLTPT